MKRILVIDHSPAVRETVAMLLAGDYELICRDRTLDGTTLAEVVAGVELLISSTGPAPWTAALVSLAARGKVAVLALADSKAVAASLSQRENLRCLGKPFTPYDLKREVSRLLNRPSHAFSAPRAVISPYLEFPFVSRATARLAIRFKSFSLPILVWGELGCGQDRVVRALLSGAAERASLLSLNGVEIGADYLKEKGIELAAVRSASGLPPVVLIESLERLSLSEQSRLLNFLDEVEGAHGRLPLLATANADLLERVYCGEFLERLYYKLATLTLPLAPLRERSGDIPALALWFAGRYATDLGLDKVNFTPAAMNRLSTYLWFGNINELDLVVARTLAIHGKARVDVADLVFDASRLRDAAIAGESGTAVDLKGTDEEKATALQNSLVSAPNSLESGLLKGMAGGTPDLRLLVHELAHELKNPMVTIKTFAQLLSKSYDDESLRAHFHDVVDGDIERMDELLDVMMEYAGFDQPRKISVALKEHLHSTLEEIHDNCAERQVRVQWKGNGRSVNIMADVDQLQYALKNILLAILSQTKTGSEIELAMGKQGSLTISYCREGERMQSLANYVSDDSSAKTENILPLRILLAREIVERSGGRFGMNQTDSNRDIVTMEFPVV
jgi:two-component system, NtrC family, response regulator HydG